MRISDWSSDVCSSDLVATVPFGVLSIMVAMWMLSGSNGESGAADMMPAILLRGFGLCFLFLSITLIAFSKLPPARVDFGIGIFNIGRQPSGLIGIAVLQTSIDQPGGELCRERGGKY